MPGIERFPPLSLLKRLGADEHRAERIRVLVLAFDTMTNGGASRKTRDHVWAHGQLLERSNVPRGASIVDLVDGFFADPRICRQATTLLRPNQVGEDFDSAATETRQA